MTTAERPKLATARVEVLRGSLDREEDRAFQRRGLLPVVFEAAIEAGGVGIRDVTELRVLPAIGQQAVYQSWANDQADAEGRERWTVPPIDLAVIDATIVWPES